MTIRKITLIFGILMANLLFAQRSKESLQKQRAELQKQIANINSELAKTKDEAKLSISYLNNINKKLSLREQVYNNTQKEKRVIEDDIYTRQLEINKLNRELKVLRENYSQTLVNAYKNKGVQNKVTFILSSKNIGEALRRVQYLKKYSEYQDKKAKEIGAKTEQIKKTIALREKAKKDKENLLIKQNQELTTIAQERKEKEILLEEFKKNETKLVAELNQKQAESRRLEGEIRRIIAEELRIAKAKEEAERKAREEKLRLARIEAEKEKKRIEEANRKAREEAERARRKAEEEERKLAELARKKAEEERKAIEAAKEAQRIAEERAKQEANERARQAAEKARLAAEKARLEAEKARQEAAEKARLAAEKAEAARESSQTVAKKIETEKKEVEQKVENTYSVGTATGSNFASNRGRMMFPVSRGQVSQRFGRQAHPVYKGVVIENNGIKITVGAGTQARSIFAGTVVNIISNGGTRTVMVKHGDYFSIYGNLSSTSVSKNQVITAGTSIGEVGLDFDGTHTLDFQIWDKTTPVDPLSWVSR